MYLFALLVGAVASSRAFAAPGALPNDAFRAQIAVAQRLMAACAGEAAACDPGALPVDAEVSRAGGANFRASWLWLREALGAAKGASGSDRVFSMRQASEQLGELAAEAASVPDASEKESVSRAQRAAAEVLARDEFRVADGPTWMARQIARAQDWFLRLLLGMDRMGAHNPWLAPFLEWICFLLAAGGLLFFVRRSLARQGLRIALGEGAAPAQAMGKDATNWARLAEERAAARDWRGAIHGVYWAAIVSLEGRRAWKPNPTRTPREYLRFLPPGSRVQGSLRRLTGSFERTWYGQAETTALDFQQARSALEEIGAADLRRPGGSGRGPDRESAPAGTA